MSDPVTKLVELLHEIGVVEAFASGKRAGRRELAAELLALPSVQAVPDWARIDARAEHARKMLPAHHTATLLDALALSDLRKLLLAASAGGDAQPASKEPT